MVDRNLKCWPEYGSKFSGKLKCSLKLNPGSKKKMGSNEVQLWEVIAVQKWIPCTNSLCAVVMLNHRSPKHRSSCYSLGCKLSSGEFLGTDSLSHTLFKLVLLIACLLFRVQSRTLSFSSIFSAVCKCTIYCV